VNKEKLDKMLKSFAEHVRSMSREELMTELDRCATEDPELVETLTEIFEQQAEAKKLMEAEARSVLDSMPDTLDIHSMMQPPPYQLSIEEIDKIYHDAKNSAHP